MSMKVNKNGKEYDLGFVPQSLYDDVEDLKANKPFVVHGVTPASGAGSATWTTTGLDFTNRSLVSIQIKNNDGNFYIMSQAMSDMSIGKNQDNTPFVYFTANVTSDWRNKECLAIYV